MPDFKKETESSKTKDTSREKLFDDAYDFKSFAAQAAGRVRQVGVIESAVTYGVLKDIPNEIIHHPLETAGKIFITRAAGTALAAAAASESPLIAGAAAAVGIVGAGATIWNTYHHVAHSDKLKQSLDAVYKSASRSTFENSSKVASEIISPEAFNCYLAVGAGLRGQRLPKALQIYYDRFEQAEILQPHLPIPEVSPSGAVEMTFADGSVLHMHGKQAMFRTGIGEHIIPSNEHGFKLGISRSELGRQVIKELDGACKDLRKIDIDTRIGITKVKTYGPFGHTASYKHSKPGKDLMENDKPWSFCYQCNR